MGSSKLPTGRGVGEPTRFDTERKAKFLLLIQNTGMLQRSARQAGVSPSTVRSHLKTDPTFKAAYEEARQDYIEQVEREAHRRAIDGWDEEVYQQGEYVGTVRKFDSRILELMLKRYVPEYKEKYEVQHSVAPGTLAVPTQASERDWESRYAGEAEIAEAETEDVLPSDDRPPHEPGSGSGSGQGPEGEA